MFHPIADLHCDLLCYLIGQTSRTPFDQVVRCSVPQLHAGHVKFQTLAVFSETGLDSVKSSMKQIELYKNLPMLYPDEFVHFRHLSLAVEHLNKIVIAFAFEGASTFCDEKESLQDGMARLQSIIKKIGKPLYISLTWNTENRFGGGTFTKVGLKEDGKRLLDTLHGQKIAIDFSHTSDQLAYDILHYLETAQLEIPVMASHSNSRTVHQAPRNLPDEIAKEIFKKQGLIGLNFYHPFVGPTDDYFTKHLAHWLEIGGKDYICFGADFFYDQDFPIHYRKDIKELFFPLYSNASCYPLLINQLRAELHMQEPDLAKLANHNLLQFLQNQCT